MSSGPSRRSKHSWAEVVCIEWFEGYIDRDVLDPPLLDGIDLEVQTTDFGQQPEVHYIPYITLSPQTIVTTVRGT